MNNITLPPLIALLLFPGGLFLLSFSLFFEWADRKLVARFQNRQRLEPARTQAVQTAGGCG